MTSFFRMSPALPGVRSVAAIDDLPMEGGSEQPIAVEGRPAEVFALQRNVSVRQATPGYFRTMGIPMVVGPRSSASRIRPAKSGRGHQPGRWRTCSGPAKTRSANAFASRSRRRSVREVVGVVGDIKDRGLEVLEPVPCSIFPIRQDDTNHVSLVVRGDGDAARLAPAITSVLAEIDPELPIRNIRTMDEMVATTLSQQRFSMWLFAALAGLAFLLASVGIYSVLAYSVRSRVTRNQHSDGARGEARPTCSGWSSPRG